MMCFWIFTQYNFGAMHRYGLSLLYGFKSFSEESSPTSHARGFPNPMLMSFHATARYLFYGKMINRIKKGKQNWKKNVKNNEMRSFPQYIIVIL